MRKRNAGDTQPKLATRMRGINSSTRSIVHVDDIPTSAFISINNTNGAPRWGLVSPEEIKGVDMLYGPFATAYPGNSIGGALPITMRVSARLEATLKQTEALRPSATTTLPAPTSPQTPPAQSAARSAASSSSSPTARKAAASRSPSSSTARPLLPGTQGTIPALNKSRIATNVVRAGGLLREIRFSRYRRR